MSMTIRGIGLAVPPNTMTQEQATELASTVICRTEQQQRVLTALYRKAGIENRHSVLPYTTALQWLPDSPTGKQQDRPATLGPTTAVRMQYFAEHAPPLAKQAAEGALQDADIDPADITHLITVSCTGFEAPGLDVALIGHLGLKATTQRLQIGFMGCHGAINGLRAALAPSLAPRLQKLYGLIDELSDVRSRIEATIIPEPPISLAEGGVIARGANPELDELHQLSRNGKQFLAEMEARERGRTGISTLKVRFNSVFGYYLEISRSNLHLVPADYERRQTLANAERFSTPELKQYEAKILDAQEKIVEIERRLFAELRADIAAEARRIRQTALALAEVDVLRGFAHTAALRNYCRPGFDDSGDLEIIAGRHPVIEQQESARAFSDDPTSSGFPNRDRFVPNDLYLNSSTHTILVVTGPNMGGKSTYLRQAALITIMAQMGSFVPASKGRLSIVDRIFTRIGASDNLARGRSTFMVEMTETAAILNTATPRSLILLDEVGRGTSTYDGLAIAWAAIEYLHARTRAKTLFATHYFELTELAEQLASVQNYHVAVKETAKGIVFLRRVEPGVADRSYGIEVAKLAGLPDEVVRRAREVLLEHENAEARLTSQLASGDSLSSRAAQLTIFTPLSQPVLEKLRETDLNRLTPLDALNLLAELKQQVQ